jgi:hypothetical protein
LPRQSFAITRAVTAQLYPDGQVLTYEGDDPPVFRERAGARLGLDQADDDRRAQTRAFWCPARLLDVSLYDPG